MRALVLGGVAWNTMVYLDRFPEPVGQTVFARGYHETVGSSGAGKALNLAGLGADVTLWGMIGDDDPGREIRAYFEAAGLTFLPSPDPTGTMRHINLMDGAGDRISIFANAGSPELSVDPDVIVPWLDGIDLCAVTIVNACKQLLPVLHDAGVEYWCDLHDYDGANPYHREFIEGAAHLQLTSTLLQDWREFMEARVAAGTRTVICTHGDAGASGLTAAEGWVDVPAVPVPSAAVVDTNGAGDAFFAGYVIARHEGAGLAAAMRRGAQHAAAAVQSTELAPTRPHDRSG
jgi:sugar/nucleoside kinase (ribokinase family)